MCEMLPCILHLIPCVLSGMIFIRFFSFHFAVALYSFKLVECGEWSLLWFHHDSFSRNWNGNLSRLCFSGYPTLVEDEKRGFPLRIRFQDAIQSQWALHRKHDSNKHESIYTNHHPCCDEPTNMQLLLQWQALHLLWQNQLRVQWKGMNRSNWSLEYDNQIMHPIYHQKWIA